MYLTGDERSAALCLVGLWRDDRSTFFQLSEEMWRMAEQAFDGAKAGMEKRAATQVSDMDLQRAHR
jgi:hypothetical protein